MRVARAFPGSSAHKAGCHPGQDLAPQQCHSDTPHTSSCWDYLDLLINLVCACFGCGRKQEDQEKPTQAWGECILHTDSGPGGGGGGG